MTTAVTRVPTPPRRDRRTPGGAAPAKPHTANTHSVKADISQSQSTPACAAQAIVAAATAP